MTKGTDPNNLTQPEIAILSLLSEGDQHPYGLNKAIEVRGFKNWTDIGQSSVYWILDRLQTAGLVSSRTDPSTKGPARKLYSLTEAGQKSLLQSITRSLSEPDHPRSRVDLAAAYIELLSVEDAIQSLTNYQLLMQERVQQIAQRRQEQEPLPFGAQIIFDHGIIKGKAEIEWVEDVLRRLKQRQEKSD
jgi:DNA-binding PadR family transcriptional regulator